MKVYVVVRTDVYTFNEEGGITEKVTGSTVEKIFTDEDRAVRYVQGVVQKWTKYYEQKFEQAESPFEKYRSACLLGGLKYMADDIREGRLVSIMDSMYYHYESHEVE